MNLELDCWAVTPTTSGPKVGKMSSASMKWLDTLGDLLLWLQFEYEKFEMIRGRQERASTAIGMGILDDRKWQALFYLFIYMKG